MPLLTTHTAHYKYAIINMYFCYTTKYERRRSRVRNHWSTSENTLEKTLEKHWKKHWKKHWEKTLEKHWEKHWKNIHWKCLLCGACNCAACCVWKQFKMLDFCSMSSSATLIPLISSSQTGNLSMSWKVTSETFKEVAQRPTQIIFRLFPLANLHHHPPPPSLPYIKNGTTKATVHIATEMLSM